jgi:hypothetical protein
VISENYMQKEKAIEDCGDAIIFLLNSISKS